ncbi:MAG: bifunctional YncE family protein/alkaline phosphatase family protein [Saprospirales bacterium]|jgi:YVTN family beta-propeller protein|nr:bifunctional YncE family protein/alkaline phosphatase family protein [Saprospirales bacterium]
MRLHLFLFALPLWVFHACKTTGPYATAAGQPILLPNGWSLRPAGRSLPLGDLPLNMALSPDGRYLAVTNNGVGRQFIQLVDTKKEKITAGHDIAKAWYGLAFSADGRYLYASGGNDNLVVRYRVNQGSLRRDTAIRVGAPSPRLWVGGLAIDDSRQRLWVAAKEDSSLYVCDLKTLAVMQRLRLETPAYACLLAPASGDVLVSLWGGRQVAVFDAQSLARKTGIPVGDHPNELLLSRNGQWLFVANANSNSVSVVNMATRREVEVLNAALYPAAPAGSTTNGLALSPDESTLYIANADNNCLAVFDVSTPGESRSKGFIPTGWYPTCVRAAGNKIFVANGKGMSSLPNPKGPQPNMKSEDYRAAEYIGELFLGTLSIIDAPDATALGRYSRQVFEHTPYTKTKELQAEGEPGNPVPMRVGDPSPVKYVFYIIKENRTYDQVLGDMPGGNGDPALCLFPEKVTPNQHALAREFVLLDNFYVNAEVSADGHNWSMAAYATDYVEKTWPTSYGGRGGGYDYEGASPLAHPEKGYIWDYCQRAGVSYRTYGEFADDYKANYPTLEGHICPNYSSWDLNIPDIEREKVWEHDFDSLLAIGRVARFNTIRFGTDHTSGMRKGAYSPEAAVADNDLAVGRMIEHLSQSPLWKESAVFILEDDAQNGPDHVDAHRSIAFLASPYVKRSFVDHTMYSTSSMLRTMELLLGLPPMSQYDAGATPMWRCFTSKPDFTPFAARPNQIPIDTRNAAVNELSRISETFQLARLDAVPERLFNEVLWKSIRGMDSEMPAPRRSAFVRAHDTEAEEGEKD